MAATTPFRVRPDTRARLNRLAKDIEISAPELLDRLVEREEQQRGLLAMNADFARLCEDPGAWADFKRETAEWGTTSADAHAFG